jgi:membrane-associated phospholipid phosphatase
MHGTCWRRTCGALALLVVATPALAQAPAAADHPEDNPRSVYRVRPSVDIPVIAGAALAMIGPYALAARLITPSCPCDPGRVNALDRPTIGRASDLAGNISDATVTVAFAAPVALAAATGGRESLEDLVVAAEAVAINGGLVSLTKVAVRRPLPRVYAGDPDLIGRTRGYRSFYSGHTSYAFSALTATSMTIGLRYNRWLAPALITGLVGTSVAVERVLAGYHFPSDVVVGAAVGTAVGIAVPLLHARQWSSWRLTLLPAAGGGLMLSAGRG